MLEITPIKMNLSSDFRCSEVIFGRLHSEFERVNNYLFTFGDEEKMITIMMEGNTLLPDSVILKKDDYVTLKKQTNKNVYISNGFLFIDQMKISFIKNSNCSLLTLKVNNFNRDNFENYKKYIIEFSQNSKKKSYFEKLPMRYDKKLNDFAASMLNDDLSLMKLALSGLIGVGKGLTPSADDAIIGVLAGYLLMLSLENKSNMYLEKTKFFVFLLWDKKLTTEISLKYLKCACNGEFSQDLYLLIQVLLGNDNKDIIPTLQRIEKIGNSSGMDMLYGLQTILKKI